MLKNIQNINDYNFKNQILIKLLTLNKPLSVLFHIDVYRGH